MSHEALKERETEAQFAKCFHSSELSAAYPKGKFPMFWQNSSSLKTKQTKKPPKTTKTNEQLGLRISF